MMISNRQSWELSFRSLKTVVNIYPRKTPTVKVMESFGIAKR
jgi:hypothetical protein